MQNFLANWLGGIFREPHEAAVARCQYVTIFGQQCQEKAPYCCQSCGVQLCEDDAYVDPMGSAVVRRDFRYCFDCLLTLN